MVVVAAVTIIETMVATEEEEGTMEEAAVAMVAMVAKEEVAMVAKVIKIIKVGSASDFQCCGKNLSAVATF